MSMLDILKKLSSIESKTTLKESVVTECPPDMGAPAAPSTPATLNISAGSASEMAQILKALTSIDAQTSPAPTTMPVALPASPMEAEYEEVNIAEAMDPMAIMGQIRKMAKGVEQSPDERAHRAFAQEVESDLIDLFQYFQQNMENEKAQAIRNLIRQNKAAQQTTDTRNANNIVEVLYGLMKGTAEAFANEPDEEYRDHTHMTKDLSGGINRQKKMFPPAAKGDNPMAVESIKDRLYRALNEKKAAKDYDGDGKVEKPSDEWKGSRDKAIKKAMGKNVKEAAKPDFLDMDKDGNKKEPMKKAIKDKKKHPFKK